LDTQAVLMAIKSKFPNTEKRQLGLLMTDEQKIARLSEWDNEDFEIMLKICEEHGITSWYELALKLAKELYTEPKKKGRKTKWMDYEKGVLVVEVERLLDDKKTIESACYQLSKIEPWKSFVETKDDVTTSPDPGEVLRKIYIAFKNDKWAETFRLAYLGLEATNKIDKWEQRVLAINSGEN
jgi:hypothetical protein